MAAATPTVAKPPTAYWLWLGENREKISKMVGSKGSEVAKKGGEMWKALPDSAKKPFECLAKEKKDAYDKYIATPEGQKALEEKQSAKADEKAEKTQKAEAIAEKKQQKEDRRNEVACKKAVKAIEKDDALKKPVSAYWLWMNDNRPEIIKMVGSGNVGIVGKKAGEMWKALPDSQKAPFEKKAKEQKDTYDKYIASEEGQKKLQAFKDATKDAKEQFKPKEKEPPAEEATENDKKRKADTQAASPAKDAGVKKARGRPAKVQTAALGA